MLVKKPKNHRLGLKYKNPRIKTNAPNQKTHNRSRSKPENTKTKKLSPEN